MTIFHLTAIDRHFGSYMHREAGGGLPWLETVVSLLSNAVGSGHICLDLAELSFREIRVDDRCVVMPELRQMLDCLERAPVVGRPGMFRPLVLDDHSRLYLYRYWEYEQELARIIRDKAGSVCDPEMNLLGEGLARLFAPPAGGEIDWQKVAAAAALRSRFCVISGGPGTGKTSTVVKILALLIEQARGETLRIALVAPTGKAAARLKESISGMRDTLPCVESVRRLIPDRVTTIHALLGPIRGSVRFRHHEANLLPFEVVIVDEASMVALPLMAKLALALRKDARLILLGDRDQLSSVEAGAVLGDICGGSRSEAFSAPFAELVAEVAGVNLTPSCLGDARSPLVDSLVVLKKNYRFGAASGIGEVGRLVRDGEAGRALELCKGRGGNISWRDVPKPDALKLALAETVAQGYEPYLTATSPEVALDRLNRFRVLCALRQGPYGVAGINALIEEILAEKGLIDPRSRWYPGHPLMITVNDHNLKLYNGDVGIIVADPEAGGKPRACFPAPEGGIRKISPLRLPAHETAYCMTVHKSQGSEFDRILLLLPGMDVEVLGRELIYTGITRAKSAAEIWGTEDVFVSAVARTISRKSGLEEALWLPQV